MIVLHQYPGVWGLTSLSPFCIKVEAFLHRSGLPYRVEVEVNPARGPKGKMPFIEDRGRTIADSSFILDYLIEAYGLTQFQEPDQKLRAQGIAFQRLIEENLYFVLLYSRWIDPEGRAFVERDFSRFFPRFLGKPALFFIRRSLRAQAQAQGMGRHSRDEVYAIGRRDLQALGDFLGEKKFLLGDRFTSVDASLYGFLITILKQPFEGQLRRCLMEFPNLVNYATALER